MRAFREAVANALLHRDYTQLGAVHIQWHEDHTEISNPGGFPEGVRLDNLLVTPPRPRNPLLADAFKQAGIVERTGRGIDIIFTEQLRNGRPAPSYERSTQNSVVLVLPGGKANLAFVRLVAEENQRGQLLGLDELLVLNRLWQERRLTSAEAVEGVLKEQGVLISQLSPDYLIDEVMGGKEEVSVAQIETVLTGSPDHPIPLNPQQTIQQAIQEGVEQGRFTITVGHRSVQEGVTPDTLLRPDTKVVLGQVSPPSLSPPPAAAILHLTANSRHHTYPLKQLLELITRLPDSVKIELKVQGDLGSKRAEIEALLKDYSISHEWEECPDEFVR